MGQYSNLSCVSYYPSVSYTTEASTLCEIIKKCQYSYKEVLSFISSTAIQQMVSFRVGLYVVVKGKFCESTKPYILQEYAFVTFIIRSAVREAAQNRFVDVRKLKMEMCI